MQERKNKQEINKNWFDDCFVPVTPGVGIQRDTTGAVLHKDLWI